MPVGSPASCGRSGVIPAAVNCSGRGAGLLAAQMGDVLAGPLGGWSKLILASSVVLGFTLIYCGWRFFSASTSEDILWWGLVTLAALMMQGFIKEWFYSRMNLLATLRELKRVQLQVALLEETRRP